MMNDTVKKYGVALAAWSTRMGWPRFTAYVLRHCIECIQPSRVEHPVRILLLPKLGFDQDMEACFQGQDGYRLYTLPRKVVKSVYYCFLPKEIDDNNYRTDDPGLNAAKGKLRRYWQRVLAHLLPRIPLDVVMTGNFSYASEQELAAAFRSHGVRFVAAHKECLKTPGLVPFYTDVYRTRKNDFQGDRVAVYNEIEAKIQSNAGVVSAEDITVTGMPRLDRVHRLRKQGDPPDRPLILMFMFNFKAGLPIIGRKIPNRFETLEKDLERLNVKELALACHREVETIARNSPDIQVVIKTKGDGQSLITMREIFGDSHEFPPNLRVMAGGDLLEVITRATVVTGLNSTALLEAVTLGVDVIVPRFLEMSDPAMQPYTLDLGQAVRYAESLEEFHRLLVELARANVGKDRSGELGAEQKKLLNHWLGNSDGQAGRRVRQLIDSLVENNG